ncbi:MAG: SDR family NAD(P)-dependent oxidoreductase [Acidobacteriota bacterium]
MILLDFRMQLYEEDYSMQENMHSISQHRDGKKIAFVTGATSGIGASFARRFAREGYNLIITGRIKNKIEAFAEELRKNYSVAVDVIIAELSNDEDVKKLIDTIQSNQYIEILINNAGFGTGKLIFEDEIDNHVNMVKTNVIAPMLLTNAVLPQMFHSEKGTIINVSSLAGFFPAPVDATYSAMKAFLTNFSESLFIQLRGREGGRKEGRKGHQNSVLVPRFYLY